MTTETRPNDRFNLSTDELNRFFAAKKISGVCPVCKTSQWGHLMGDGAPLWSLTGFPNAEAVQPFIVLRCKNCSYVRLHGFAAVRDWLAENPVEASK